MTQTLLEVQPHSLEAEQTVLGALLMDPEAIVKISDLLVSEDFYEPAYRTIYSVIQSLYQSHQPIDIITVTSKLQDDKKIQGIGGSAFLAELSAKVPTSAHIYKYAQLVKTKAIHRKIIRAGDEIKALGYEIDKEIPELLEQVEKKVFGISATFLKEKFVHIRDILSARYEKFAEMHESKDGDAIKGVPTGFMALDLKLSGFQPSDLIIIAARPSMGKTSLALNIAQNAAIKHGKAIGIFSLEMSKEQLVDRLFASMLGVESWRTKTSKTWGLLWMIWLKRISSSTILWAHPSQNYVPKLGDYKWNMV